MLLLSLIDSLNALAQQWWVYVFHASWQAMLVAAVVLAMVWIGRRMPSPWRYALLLVVVAKFAAPPILSVQTGMFYWLGPVIPAEPAQPSIAVAPSMPGESAAVSQPAPPMQIPQATTEPLPAPPAVDRVPEPADSAAPGIAAESAAPSLAERFTAALAAVHWKTWLMLIHTLGVIVLLLWIVAGFLQLRIIALQAVRVQPGGDASSRDAALLQRFEWLAKRLKLADEVDLLITDAEIPPVAYWLLRPKVMLPRTLVDRLSMAELEAVLAHELLHHRRNDWAANLLSLLLCAAWWFNPMIWLVDRTIRRVREECCDDALIAEGLAAGESYSRTLLTAAEHLQNPQMFATTLGFGESQHPVAERIKRIMDPTLKRISGLSPIGLGLLVLLCLAVLPGTRSEAEKAEEGNAAAAESKLTETVTFRVTADGKPLPGVEVALRYKSYPKEYRTAVTNEKGVAELKFDPIGEMFLLATASKDGYVPTSAMLRRDGEPIEVPKSYEVSMQPSTRIGGKLVDEQGKPIAGARVKLFMVEERSGWQPPGTVYRGRIDFDAKTDAEGRWACPNAARFLNGFNRVTFRHESFGNASTSWTGGDTEVIDSLVAGTQVTEMKKMPAFRATIVDEAGQPIEGVSVTYRDGPSSDTWTVKSDREGRVSIRGVELYGYLEYVAVHHPEYAPISAPAKPNEGEEPSTITLERGGDARVRVLDAAGKPIANAAVVINMPDMLESKKLSTNGAGEVVIQHVPKEGVWVAASTADMEEVNLVVKPGNDARTFTLKHPRFGTVRALDAQTGQPIDLFRVQLGDLRFEWNKTDWDTDRFAFGRAGIAKLQRSHSDQNRIRVFAEGYRAVEGKWEDTVHGDGLTVRLEKNEDFTARVLLPDGSPAENATVVLALDGDQVITLKEAWTVDIPLRAIKRVTDSSGEFRIPIPAEASRWKLAVIHELGVGEWSETQLKNEKSLKLTPWGSLTGRVVVGDKPIPFAEVQVYGDSLRTPSAIGVEFKASADGAGTYEFFRVPPGRVTLARRTGAKGVEPQTRQMRWSIIVPPGESQFLTLGGDGRPIIGKVDRTALPAEMKDLPVSISVYTSSENRSQSNPRYPEGYQDWTQDQLEEYFKPEGEFEKRYKEYIEGFQETVRFSGYTHMGQHDEFRMDDLPPGKYILSVEIQESQGLTSPGPHREYTASTAFEIPAFEGKRVDEPLDLGTLTLEKTAAP